MADRIITTPTGARIGMSAAGDPVANRIVVLCHPSPGASEFDPEPVVTARWGVHLLAFDRPGYGSSQEDAEGRLIGGVADDVAAIVGGVERSADRLSDADLHRFGVIGWGTGGVLAAAIAARHPERVDRLALVGTPAADRAPALVREAIAAGPGIAALGVRPDDSDLARHPGLLGRIERMLESAFLQEEAGLRSDLRLVEDAGWLPTLSRVTASTHVWIGDRDRSLDERDVEWWAARIPGVKAHRVRDSGPLAVAASWSRILAHVAPHRGEIPDAERDTGAVLLPEVDPVRPERDAAPDHR